MREGQGGAIRCRCTGRLALQLLDRGQCAPPLKRVQCTAKARGMGMQHACRTRTEHAQNGQEHGAPTSPRPHRAPCAIRVSLLRLSLGTGAGHPCLAGCLAVGGSCSRQASFARCEEWAAGLLTAPGSSRAQTGRGMRKLTSFEARLTGSSWPAGAVCSLSVRAMRPQARPSGSRQPALMQNGVRRGCRLRDERRATIGAERALMKRTTRQRRLLLKLTPA